MRNKTIHLLLTAFFLLLPNYVSAYSFSAVNEDGIIINVSAYSFSAVNEDGVTIYYNIISSTAKTVSVTYKDSNYKSYSGSVNIPESVEYNGGIYSVTSIGYNAFDNCSSLTSVTIPNSVTSIGSYAFRSCSSLTSVTIPNSVTSIGGEAFSYCSCLTSVTIPNSVTSIGGGAFQRCSGLTSINIPNSVTSIGNYAFQDCSGLTSVTIPNSVTSIGSYAFQNCSGLSSITIPNSITSIGSGAFSGCRNITTVDIEDVSNWLSINGISSLASSISSNSTLTLNGEPLNEIIIPEGIKDIPRYAFFGFRNISSVTIPNSVTSIGYGAFGYCSGITSITIPNSVTSIEGEAFYGLSGLTSMTIPNSVTSIGELAFAGCRSLTSVTIPNSVTSIGHGAFSGCSGLTSITIPNSVTSIESTVFNNCSSLTSVTIPNSVTSIGNSAFSRCSGLTTVTIPNSVTSIGNYAFESCSGLTSITIPNYVTSIGYEAFKDCRNLNSVTIPNLVTSIGHKTFYNCSNLTSITIQNSVTNIGSSAFYGCPNINSLRIGSAEQWCNINFDDYYANPLYNTSKSVTLYIDDSETPATEIIIPASVQQVPQYAFYKTGIHTIHFEGINPPTLENINSIPGVAMLAVPDDAYETYLAANVYKTIPLQITKESLITQEVELEASSTTSKLLEKIGQDNVKYVVNLKIKGTINSYDMLIIRNRMTSLRNLDLSEASIIDCDYVYSNANGTNHHSKKDVVDADWLSGVMYLKLPASTKTINSKAFYKCDNLICVNIPDGVTYIGSDAFYYCGSIKELKLPSSITRFGSHAFCGCRGLKEVTIPAGARIDQGAFYDCYDLEKVYIPENVATIEALAFNNIGISLHIGNLKTWLENPINSEAFYNVKELYIGESTTPVENIVFPEEVTELKDNIFTGFKCIKSVTFPKDLKTIGNGVFSGCSNLENIEFTDSLKKIGQNAFKNCVKFTKIELPAYLQEIGQYAFSGCSNLTEILIPASIKGIGDYAFSGCSKMNRVIATTVEPIAINQNTFSTYRTATLFSPKTSYYKYFWNTQYNQFLDTKEYDKEFAKSFGYKYFYLNGVNGDKKEDFEISDETGPIHGIDDDAPDADFNEGSGIIVGGEQVQELGDIHIHHNGNNGASVIAKAEGKVHIDNLYVDIKVQKNRWYFFCFPFDINPGEAKFGGSYVWYLYDGEARAMNGNGGWKKIAADGVMKSGNGYIFQGAVNGTLSIHVADVTIDASDSKTNMITYQSENKNDASWNLIGNPNIAYYDMDNLEYEAPITVYNNETGNYEAVRPGDDDYEFYPFQAFFVQKPEDKATMDFDSSKKETKNKSDEKKAKKIAARANAPRLVNAMRKVINLEIASAEMVADSASIPSDRTRIVVNPTKSVNYETDCDAAKFIADDMLQIYSLDNAGCMYSINERSVENGIINIAVKAAKEGFYTISASRMDCCAKLRDLETGMEVDLAKNPYVFAAKATTYTKRFLLILADETTSVGTPEVAMNVIEAESGAIRVNDASADVMVYSVGGALIASQKGSGSINVPVGTYMVTVNGQATKVIVK